jgi:predicted nucleic acid-binding Zn ribbon protein
MLFDMTPSTATALCLVCGTAASADRELCSLSCAVDAHEELRENVETVKRLRRAGAPEERLRALTERNGRLSSALIRWRH